MLGRSTNAEDRGSGRRHVLSSSAMRSHVIIGMLMSALGTYVGKSRAGMGGTTARGLLGLLAALGAGGAGFVLGATATLERLQLGRL